MQIGTERTESTTLFHVETAEQLVALIYSHGEPKLLSAGRQLLRVHLNKQMNTQRRLKPLCPIGSRRYKIHPQKYNIYLLFVPVQHELIPPVAHWCPASQNREAR